jgi:hypothetical protein
MIVAELAALFRLTPDSASFEKGHALIGSLRAAIGAQLGEEGLNKVKELVQGTVEAAVSAKHLGERLNITGEAVQELGYAADVTGASAETITSAMQRLAVGLEHAKKGTGPLVSAMAQLHIPIANLRKEKLDQNLEEIADGFANASPNVDKLALSIEIFGRQAGPKLLPLLLKGKAGIVELREEAQKLGVVIDEEGIQKAEEFEIAQKKLGATLKGVRNEAVIAMLPALQEMTEGLSAWVKENREAIAAGLAAVLHGIAAAFHVVGEVLSFVIDLFKEHQDVVLALVLAVGVYESAAIGAAIASAAAWVLSFLPLVLGVAAITAVTLGLIKLAEWITGKTVTFRALWDAFLAGGKAAEAWLEALPAKAEAWISEVASSIADEFEKLWADVVKGAHEAWESIKDIPVIGHIIKGASFLADKTGLTASVGTPSLNAALAAANGAPSVQGPASALLAGAGITANFGDTHIQIDAAGMTPDELKGAVKDAAREAHQDVVRQAFSNISGGRR